MKLLQHDALNALEEAAIQDEALAAAHGQAPPDARATFAGLTREKLLKRAARIELPTASKKLKRFRRDTQKLIAEKTERGHWAGFHETLPQLRRRPGTSQMIVREGPAAPRAELKRRQQLRETSARLAGKRRTPAPVIIDLLEDDDDIPLQEDLAAQAGKPAKYRKVSQATLEKATCVKVQSGSDLLHGEADSHKLQAWLSIVALGQEVHTKDSQRIAFKAALPDPHTLSFSGEFSSKHHHLSGVFRRYAAREGSQWKVTSTEAAPPKNKALATHVDTMDDFRRWLISARRFSSWAGVGIDGVDVRRGGISRYGRETVSVA